MNIGVHMFAEACAKVAEFSKPVVISTRHQDGSVTSECGTFIVLNRDGWIITAGHMYDAFVRYQSDLKKAQEINELNATRSSKPGAPSSQVKLDPTFITNHSFWWGWDGTQLTDVHVNRQLDMCIGRLEPFNPDWVREYPVLRDPDTLRPGTSVCRSGYPFIKIEGSWDDQKKAFRIPALPARDLIFPNEGIHTRTVDRGVNKDWNCQMLYVETSSPGLKGQSGGPIFDREGHLYAMQVQTMHLPLGFQPTVEMEGRTVIENQFLNVGLGIHIRTIRNILDTRGVRYDAEEDESGYRIIE